MARNHTNVVLEADVGSAGGELDYSSTEVVLLCPLGQRLLIDRR